MRARTPAVLPAHERQWRFLLAVLIVFDALAVGSSLRLAFSVRMTSGLLGQYEAAYDPAEYLLFTLISIPVWLGVFWLTGLYQRDNLLGGLVEYQYIFRACTVGVVLLIVLSFFWRDYAMLSRGWLALSWALSLLFVTAGRFTIRRFGYWARRRGWLTSRVLIIGANDQGLAMASQWLTSPTSGMEVVGFLDDFKPLGTSVIYGIKVIGRPSALEEVVCQINAQEVIVVPTAVAWESFEKLVVAAPDCVGYTLRFSPGFYEILATGVAVTSKTFVPLYTVNEARLVGVEGALKTIFDYGFTFHLLIYALPVMSLIALALKVIAPGEPVLVRLPTLGEHGRLFTMYKFRTAHRAPRTLHDGAGPGEEQAAVAMAALERLLSRTGLDKLPQVFNVLRQEMSLVGPRPQVTGHNGFDHHALRTIETVKPGVTGFWALAEGPLDSIRETEGELRYVRNWTLWLDIQILFQSVRLWVYSGFWPGKARAGCRKGPVQPCPRGVSDL